MMKHKRTGFSLVELLVALVVSSVGLLGVATLSLQSSRYNFDAKLRHQATMLTSDMADRIRSNPVAAATNYLGTAANNNCDPTTITTPCTAAERAAQDLWELDSLVNQLPNGGLTIATVAGTTSVDITVSWSEIAGDFVVNQTAAVNPVTRTVTIRVLP